MPCRALDKLLEMGASEAALDAGVRFYGFRLRPARYIGALAGGSDDVDMCGPDSGDISMLGRVGQTALPLLNGAPRYIPRLHDYHKWR